MSAVIDKEVVKTVDETNISQEMRRNMSYNAIITPGEASESDEDEEQNEDEDRIVSFADQITTRSRKISEMSQSQRSRFSDDSSSIGDTTKYNTLLHKKLREKNEQLKRELTSLACGPFNMATKEVGSISKQLIQSQKLVQNVSSSLRKVSKELIHLEDTIAAIKNDKNFLLKEFIITGNSSVDESKESESNDTMVTNVS
ncbi:uncharacterized protein LOC128956828 [Oppia nitens]|uniref:uncharacterized protein LOC128956828 n=1 Tax=Oppia nitens TaxID=1686743 RepID=UPI0023DBDDAD|nr:uncharacterized protein LOC128956828 [Oppia nitens]XP_054158621.1 uncharacterized protein LOC128956828 [Oppia nitens]